MKKPVVVILSGGIGKSFAPLSVNKTLLPIFGKPVLQHMLEMVEQSGFREAFVITNPANEAWLASYQPFNILIQTKIQDRPAGMGHALLQLEQEIYDRPILIMNGVDFIDPLFMKKIYLRSFDGGNFITGMKVDSYVHGGYLKTTENRITDIIEKPGDGNQPGNLINLVFHYFSDPSHFLEVLKITPEEDHQYEKALSVLMKDHEISVLPYSGYWQKLKHSYHTLDLMDVFLKHRIKNYQATCARVSKNAVIEGDVFIDDGAEIDSFAVIKGPAYIGKRVKIGNHALVRQSIIEEDSVVGFGSEVARSYIGPRCMLHHNFFGDSILESDINPSWGTTGSNMRLDGKSVRMKLPNEIKETGRNKLGAIIAKGAFLGVNCSIMPGVTIGKNARVNPNTVVSDAVASNE